jgi:hypothetical protein
MKQAKYIVPVHLFIALAFLNKLVDGFRLERRTALFLLINARQVQHRTVPFAMMNGRMGSPVAPSLLDSFGIKATELGF